MKKRKEAILIDFVKVLLKREDVPINISKHKHLNFTRAVNVDTGELKKDVKFREAEYMNLKFKLYDSGNLLITGSLHKYFNKGLHNYNSFSKAKLDIVLNDLYTRFSLKLDKCRLQNLEVGLNIKPPIKSAEVVRNILMHFREPFKYYSIKDSEYKQAIHQRYYIKAYDKRLMYNNKNYVGENGKIRKYQIDNEIFRFELKFVKMEILNHIGIYTLADLKSVSKLRVAFELLFETWDNLIFYDPTIETKNLTAYVKNTKLNQWQNTSYWYTLKKQRRLEQKKAMEKVIKIHSDNIKGNISKKLQMEARELLFDYSKKMKSNNDNSLPMNRDYKEYNSLLFNTSYIGIEGNILCTHFNITNLVNRNYLFAV